MNVDEVMTMLLARSPSGGKLELLLDHALSVAQRASNFINEYCFPFDNQEKSRAIVQELAYLAGLIHDTVGKALNPYQDWFKDNSVRFDPKVPHHHLVSWLSIRILHSRGIIGIEYPGHDKILTALESAVVNHHLRPVTVIEQTEGYPPEFISYENASQLLSALEPYWPSFISGFQILRTLLLQAKFDFISIDNLKFETLLSNLESDPSCLQYEMDGKEFTIPKLFEITCQNLPSHITKHSVPPAPLLTELLRAALLYADRESVRDIEGIRRPFNTFTKYSLSDLEKRLPPVMRERWERIQKDIVKETSSALELHNSVVISAPTGLGKTLLSLIASLSSGKRVFYVCPQRDIARSTYHNLLSLLRATESTEPSKVLDNLNLNDISVQLYFNGTVQDSVGTDEPFSARLIVLTIDAFLSPSHKFNRFDYSELYSADMVFDEYHLLMSTPAMLSLFSRMMLIRNVFTRCRSIFISATPEQVHWLWNRYVPGGDSMEFAQTKVLPDEFVHYPCTFPDNRYFLKYLTENEHRKTPPGGVQYYNTVRDTRADKDADIHGHGDALEFHKKLNFEELQKRFGKQSKDHESRAALCQWGAYGFDVSFRSVGTSIAPLYVFIQRVGRAIRFAGGQECNITVYEIPGSNLSERALWDKLWGNSVEPERNAGEKCFREMITEYFQKFVATHPEVSLDELYRLYNEFNSKNSSYMRRRLEETSRIGFEHLKELSPRRYFSSQSPGAPEELPEPETGEAQDSVIEDVVEQGASSRNNLRNPGRTFYLLTKHLDSTRRTRDWILRSVNEDYLWMHFHTNGYTSDIRRNNQEFFSEYASRMKGIRLGETVLKRFPRLKRLEAHHFIYNLQQAAKLAQSPDSPLIDLVFEYHVKNFKEDVREYRFEDLGEGLLKSWNS